LFIYYCNGYNSEDIIFTCEIKYTMKEFFKFFTASCLGVFAAIALIFLFFAGFLGSAMSNKPVVPKNTVLELDFSAFIPEKSDNVEISPLDLEAAESIGLDGIKALLKHAATDDKVKGILIKGDAVSGGQATISSIREALTKFKESEKFVYAYADFYTQSGYFLSSVADSIFLNPNGMVDVKGFATLMPFFKDAMDKAGVKANVFYAGNFKSATEPFRREDMSEPNRLQTREFLSEMVDMYKNTVAPARGMTPEDLDVIMTEYKGKTATTSLEAGLVDRITYWDEVETTLRSKLDIKPTKKIKLKSLSEYRDAVTLKQENSSAKDKIAVLFAEGTISYKTDEKGSVSETKYLKALEKIKNDDNIKALVLRVNSGGGSSITSDMIWRGIENVKAAGKPVVASFGDYAASGGYYIAAGADTIVSSPNCLTGSIGVFMLFPNLSDLATNKLGITFDEVKTHPMAIGPTMVKELNEKEKQLLQEGTNDIYEIFLKRVGEGRGMTRDEVHEIAQGRVWTGKKGQEIGLVDVLGDLEDAIRIAGEMADIETYKLKSYPIIKEDPWAEIVKGLAKSGNVQSTLGISETEIAMMKEYKEIKNILIDRTPQARLPFIVKFD